MLKKGFLGWLKLNMNYLFFRVKYINEENLELIDKAVVCPNHSHAFDPFWVYFKVPNTWIMAKAELFKNKLMKFLLVTYNCFPIERGKKDARSLVHAIKAIEDHEHSRLLIFPEGTRIKKDKERGRAKVGPVFIASKAGVPLLPVYIKKNPKIFSKVYVVFGKPIELPEDVHKDKEKMQEYSDMLLDEIYKLKEQIPTNKNKKK